MRFEDTRLDGNFIRKGLKKPRRVFYLPHTHARPLVAGIREALDTCDFEQGLLLNLYKVAHYESAVDKWDNFSRAISPIMRRIVTDRDKIVVFASHRIIG